MNPEPDVRPKKILLVEDDEVILETVGEVLSMAGYRVEFASDGLQALEILKTGERPSLIILDLKMPRMDGYEFCEHQEKDPAIAPIPVLVMTADGRVDVQKFKIAARECLRKPLELESFLAAVARCCG